MKVPSTSVSRAASAASRCPHPRPRQSEEKAAVQGRRSRIVPRGSSYDGERGILLVMGTAINVKQLSKDERLDLIEQLWESLSDEERDSLPLAGDQEEELDRRLDALDREGPVGISSDELRKQIRGRSS